MGQRIPIQHLNYVYESTILIICYINDVRNKSQTSAIIVYFPLGY